MIPKYSFLALKTCLKLGSLLHVIPYEWDNLNEKLVVRPSLYLFYMNKVIHLLQLAFVVTSFFHAQENSDGSVEETETAMIHMLFLSIFLTTNLFNIGFFAYRKESPLFLNSLLSFNRHHKGDNL